MVHLQAADVLAAQSRQDNHTAARTLATVWDVVCRYDDANDPCAHGAEPGRGAVAVVALIGAWSESVARAKLELARAVLVRFPYLHEARACQMVCVRE